MLFNNKVYFFASFLFANKDKNTELKTFLEKRDSSVQKKSLDPQIDGFKFFNPDLNISVEKNGERYNIINHENNRILNDTNFTNLSYQSLLLSAQNNFSQFVQQPPIPGNYINGTQKNLLISASSIMIAASILSLYVGFYNCYHIKNKGENAEDSFSNKTNKKISYLSFSLYGTGFVLFAASCAFF